MSTWDVVAARLEQQAGVISRVQLDRLGVGRHLRRRWADEHRLEPVVRGVWRVGGSPVTWEQRLHTGLLALGRMSWVSHEAAGQLHGFDRTPADRVEFLVLRNRRCAELDETVHSTRRWGPVDEVTVGGVRCTSATRTILDLANAQVHPDRIKAAIDTAVRLELSSPEVIRQRLDAIRSRGRAGVRRVEELLEDAGGHTMLERRFLELMRASGLPRPEPQVVIRDGRGGFVARVDFLYREWAVVVEVSGRLGHSSPAERQRDAQRRNELQDLGYVVYEFTWEDVTERPVWVAAALRARLRTAGWPD